MKDELPLTKESKEAYSQAMDDAMNPNKVGIGKVKLQCPNCKREVELDETKLKYHKTGRKVDCPECGKEFLLRRYVRRPV
jgi:predicted RNA-binding Zn-ribbon protein involved in translation (DUF1610 family)